MNTVSRRAEARQTQRRGQRGDAEHQLLGEGVAVELEDGIGKRREHDGERGHLDHQRGDAAGGRRHRRPARGVKRGTGVVARRGRCSVGKALSWGANGLAARSITWSARGKPCASRVRRAGSSECSPDGEGSRLLLAPGRRLGAGGDELNAGSASALRSASGGALGGALVPRRGPRQRTEKPASADPIRLHAARGLRPGPRLRLGRGPRRHRAGAGRNGVANRSRPGGAVSGPGLHLVAERSQGPGHRGCNRDEGVTSAEGRARQSSGRSPPTDRSRSRPGAETEGRS